MFPLLPNYEDESKAYLSTALEGAQQFQVPPHVSNMIQPTNFTVTGNWENLYGSQENWMRMKRQRSLDGESLVIRNEFDSSQFQMNGVGPALEPPGFANFGVGNGVYGDEYYRNYPYQIVNGFGMGNANEVSAERQAVEKAYQYHHQFVTGFSKTNGNEVRAHRTVGAAVTETPASERIHRRMIKNRESAARSRARKQAYDAQKQLEIMKLKKENELLRRVIRVLLVIMRMKPITMPTLARTFSAPL